MITWVMSGSSALLHSHGIPAPHMQPNSSLQARSGWFSHTHPMPKHTGQFLSIGYLAVPERSAAPPRGLLGGSVDGAVPRPFLQKNGPTLQFDPAAIVPTGTNQFAQTLVL